MSEEERIKNIYSKYTISSFWDWWCSGENKVMEVRIKDYNLIKQTAEKFDISYSRSGVYVWNHIMLKNVIAFVREKATVWFGINPRKKNWNPYTGYKSFGGLDPNIEEIGFLFCDIDRIEKQDVASQEDLKNCDILIDKILEALSKEGWNKNYVKICSGNGVQLIIKLDFPIKLPDVEFINKDKIFLFGKEFEEMRDLIRSGMGYEIKKFSLKFRDELNVDLDKSGFNIGRVGALPVTKNLKYNTFKWRGIIDLKDGVNEGLSDYILSKLDDIKTFKEKNVFFKSKSLLPGDRIKPGKFFEHELVRYMLKAHLPYGEINNKLWFQLKCLVRDSGFEINNRDYLKFKALMEKKLNGKLSPNFPDKRFNFNGDIINSFCINSRHPPMYKLWSTRKQMDFGLNYEWNLIYLVNGAIKLESNTTIQEDLKHCQNLLKEGNTRTNNNIVAMFIKGLIKKYGEKDTKYFFKYLFERGLTYK